MNRHRLFIKPSGSLGAAGSSRATFAGQPERSFVQWWREAGVALVVYGLLSCLGSSAAANDSAWGDLRIRFVYEGKPPVREALELVPRDRIDADVRDESLLVDSNHGGIANVALFLYPPRGTEPPEAHPVYYETAEARVKIEMHEGRFEPHVLLLRTTQTMVQVNDDEIGYAPHLMLFNNSPM